MRKVLLLSILLCSAVLCFSQQTINAKRVTVTENLKPPIDTLIAPAYLNEVRLRLQDTSWYVARSFTGKKWYRVTVSVGDPLLFHDGRGKTYFISPSGSDANHGLSPDLPWQTISKVNATNFEPGDVILFEGGQTFSGTVTLTAEDRGAPGFPVVISSYGAGRAKISSGAGNGVDLRNMEYVEVRKLEIFGNATVSGAQENHGVYIFQDQNTKNFLTHFVVEDCLIYSYSYKGVNVSSWDYVSNTAATTKSFDSVRIINNEIHHCAFIGIYTEGDWPAYNHRNLYVAFNRVHHCMGNIGVTSYPSGSAIQISGFDGGIIEYNEAYENGAGTAGFTDGGGLGIWAVDASHITIQYNESHHNHAAAGSNKDGGGFDFDGGTTKSIMQYNYSHDNAGPGFMVYDYGSSEMDSLVIRYNVSLNDAKASPNYGSLYFGGTIANNIKKLFVYNNTAVMNDGVSVVGRAGLGFPALGAAAIVNFYFYNNIIYTNGQPTVGTGTLPVTTAGANNIYWSPIPGDLNLALYGTQADPLFARIGYVPSSIGVSTLTPLYRNPFLALLGYTPQGSSPAVDIGTEVFGGTPIADIIGAYIMVSRDAGALETLALVEPSATITLDFPSTPPGGTFDLSIPVIGAQLGDMVNIGIKSAVYPSGAIFVPRVSAPGQVTIRLFVRSGGPAVNPPPLIFKARIIR